MHCVTRRHTVRREQRESSKPTGYGWELRADCGESRQLLTLVLGALIELADDRIGSRRFREEMHSLFAEQSAERNR
jgi:hypothetical protein